MNLYDQILQALNNTKHVTRRDIAPVDEFHIRGAAVSQELANAANLRPGMRVLDAGCGIGGACRMLTEAFGCEVTGIDISAEYIHTAQQLSTLTGIRNSSFVQGSVTNMPFAGNSFDVVWTQHVQMNIADKTAFYAEVVRVLRPGGRFIYYDILSNNHLPVQYPTPWANEAADSFLITPAEMQALLLQAGLRRQQVTEETGKGLAFMSNLITRINQKGLPALGLHLLMGNMAEVKLYTLYSNLHKGHLVLESGMYEK